MADYRERIYARYAGVFQERGARLDLQTAERWGRAYDWYLRGWLPRDKGAAIADLGCGSGALLHFLKTRGYEAIHGVDVSAEQVALARQVCASVEQANVLDYLAGQTSRFDFITALDLVEHLRKDEVLDFLDRCLLALKPGGRLVLQTPNANSPWAAQVRYGDFTHEVCFDPGSLQRLLRLCRFESQEFRELGPAPRGYSVLSTFRWAGWQTVRVGLKLYNVIETGSSGGGIFTRVFLAAARKPAGEP